MAEAAVAAAAATAPSHELAELRASSQRLAAELLRVARRTRLDAGVALPAPDASWELEEATRYLQSISLP